MALITRGTHCASKAEFSALMRHWYDGSDEETVGDLGQVQGVTTWITVRAGTHTIVVHADTKREGVRRYLELVSQHGPEFPWRVGPSRTGKIDKVFVEPDGSATAGFYVYSAKPLKEPAAV
ncbi:MAG TPA: hypothetical protein VH418_13370 [Solirubrobacteraceae bacterium]